MQKIIWIDVGTHFGQEVNSVFGSDLQLYYLITKRYILGNFLRLRKPIDLRNLKKMLKTRSALRARSNDFFTILIEANHKIVRTNDVYAKSDLTFNFALMEGGKKKIDIIKLYLGNGDELSQGSSIYLQKDNVQENSYISTVGICVDSFFKELESFISERYPEYKVLLRLNCEGLEDNVIYAAHKTFRAKLQLVCGSLKDVDGVKGPEAANALVAYMDTHELPFVYFYSGMESWSDAHLAILNLHEH